MRKNKGLALTTAGALLAIGLAGIGPAQAVNFGDMMSPGKWMPFGSKNRDDGPPPPGYGDPYGYGPPGGYYGQPGVVPPGGYGGAPGYYGAPGGYGAPAPGYGNMPAPPMGGGYGAQPAPAADPSQERIQELEQRIQQLERQQGPQGGYPSSGFQPMR